jgi:hypothetical protein
MKNIISLLLISGVLIATTNTFSTTSVVTLVGGKILASKADRIEKKYRRKDCPVCKGKGWYMSGDGISKVDCGYCEPEPQLSVSVGPIKSISPTTPSSSSQNHCINNKCNTIRK